MDKKDAVTSDLQPITPDMTVEQIHKAAEAAVTRALAAQDVGSQPGTKLKKLGFVGIVLVDQEPEAQ